MAVLAERMRGRKREAPGLGARAPARGGRHATLSAGLATVVLLAVYAVVRGRRGSWLGFGAGLAAPFAVAGFWARISSAT